MSSTVHKRYTPLGRNEPCGCGSGRKYKRCCLSRETTDKIIAMGAASIGEDATDPEVKRRCSAAIRQAMSRHVRMPPERRKQKSEPEPAPSQAPLRSECQPEPEPERLPMTNPDNISIPDKYMPRNEYNLLITPAMARFWLDNLNYGDNRPISRSRVAYYVRQVKAGRWVLNGQPIIFDSEPRLLNGQHRLSAIVEANKAIHCDIRTGIATDAFTTMDQGWGRSGGQVLGMRGLKNATARAAVCRALYIWEVNNGKLKGYGKVSPDELLLVNDCYPDEVDEATAYVVTQAAKGVPMPRGLMGLSHILFHRARPRKAGEFFEVLAEGLTTTKGHPALVMRNRLIQDKMRDRTMPDDAIWCALVRAWNTYDHGKTMKNVVVKRNPDGEWVQQAIRGLGRKRTGGKVAVQ